MLKIMPAYDCKRDMIAVYNFLNGKYDIDYFDFLTFSTTTHIRGHMFKLFKSFSRIDAKRCFFFTRTVVEPWNNLPHEVVCAESEDHFKKLIDSNSMNIMYSVCN